MDSESSINTFYSFYWRIKNYKVDNGVQCTEGNLKNMILL